MLDFATAHTDEPLWSVSMRSMAPDSDYVAAYAAGHRCAVAVGDGGSCAHGVAEIYSNPADRYLAYRHRRMRTVVKPIAIAS